MTVRVVAPCRLHFGLFHVPVAGFTHRPDGRPVRKFGGVGLIVEWPAVTVEVRRSPTWSAAGSLGERALGYARRVWESRPDLQDRTAAFAVVADGPPEHVGLGVGTALGMAVGYAVFREVTWPRPDFPVGVAKLVGRGLRSGIGVHGFAHGGLIVDGGKTRDDETSYPLERLAFPADWRVVLFRPPVASTWHGDRERTAFRRHRSVEVAVATTNRLHDLAFGYLAPAARAADFRAFADAVYAFNRTAGEPFAEDQGGPYAAPEVAELVAELRSWGVAGTGQSSWGPTVFAFAADPREADALADRGRHRFPDLIDVTVTPANNHGVTDGESEVEWIRDADQPDQQDIGRQHE